MDFGPTPTTSSGIGSAGMLHHSMTKQPTPPSNETRAEKLKREYAQKNQNASRVWDPIDERWVEADTVETKSGSSGGASGGLLSGNSGGPASISFRHVEHFVAVVAELGHKGKIVVKGQG